MLLQRDLVIWVPFRPHISWHRSACILLFFPRFPSLSSALSFTFNFPFTSLLSLLRRSRGFSFVFFFHFENNVKVANITTNNYELFIFFAMCLLSCLLVFVGCDDDDENIHRCICSRKCCLPYFSTSYTFFPFIISLLFNERLNVTFFIVNSAVKWRWEAA